MIGKMRFQIALQKPVASQDAGGGEVVAWVAVETVWAELKPSTSREYLQSMGIANAYSHKVVIRYRSDVRPDWRFTYDGRTFNIRSVQKRDERTAYLDMTAEEGVPV